MRVLIAGSSGLLGTALTARLRKRGDEVYRLVRRTADADDERSWDPVAGTLEAAAVSGFDAVVNLAGAGIGDKRWSDEHKSLLRSSRIDSTRLLAATLAGSAAPPGVLVSGSAIGFYGERGDEELDEGSPGGDTFLARLANDWEAAAVSAEQVGIRVAHLRTGIVLSTKGGALAKLVTPFKLGVGGRIGDGRSWWSWIAIEDHLAAIEAIIDGDLAGPVNLTAPNSVRSAEFTDALGNALRRPTLIPTPRFALNVLLGSELAAALLFTSSRVMPRALLDSGFSFEHPSVGGALAAALE